MNTPELEDHEPHESQKLHPQIMRLQALVADYSYAARALSELEVMYAAREMASEMVRPGEHIDHLIANPKEYEATRGWNPYDALEPLFNLVVIHHKDLVAALRAAERALTGGIVAVAIDMRANPREFHGGDIECMNKLLDKVAELSDGIPVFLDEEDEAGRLHYRVVRPGLGPNDRQTLRQLLLMGVIPQLVRRGYVDVMIEADELRDLRPVENV